MWFLLLIVVSAQPFYKEMLRQLPEKLRQQRIHAKVQTEVDLVHDKILEHAANNQTYINFTLFCLDPNRQYREHNLWNQYLGRIPEGLRVPHYSIDYGYSLGYYPYKRDGPRYRFLTKEEREKETELIHPRPYCEPKHGYILYQRRQKLEDTPEVYTALFFKKLNNIFPDLPLTVSDKRPSEGLYDADCCPLFTVSW
jgi:hypothetical protein